MNNQWMILTKISHYFLGIVLLLLLASCEKENEINIPELINSYDSRYMHYPSMLPMQNNEDYIVDLQYKNQKIVKRIGVVTEISLGYILSKNYYDTLIYTNNSKINIIQKYKYAEEDRSYNDRIVILDSHGRMSKKLYDNSSTDNRVDTVHFYYDIRNLLIKSYQRSYGSETVSDYFYNSNHNLDSIVTVTVNINSKTSRKAIETFSDYDNSDNPLKHLIIFDEIFKRALSTNNYQKYTYDLYDSEGNSIAYERRAWQLAHDGNGKVLFDK